MKIFFLLGLAAIAMAAPDVPTSVANFVQQVIENRDAGKAFNPEKWSGKLELQGLDMNKLLKMDFPDGTAYGAVATKLINTPYEQVKAFLLKQNGGDKLVRAVKTNRNFERQDETRTRLNIKVPVVSDIRTEVTSKLFEDAQGRCILEWRQSGDYGDLVYNHGAVVVSADTDPSKSRVLVVGVHIIKPERRVPWLGRGTAKSFAKTHYGNFVEALEDVLAAQQRESEKPN